MLAQSRQSHVAQIEALEDKYQAMKNVCVQLEFRVLDLAGQLEVARTLGTETRPKPRTLSRGASAESVAIDTRAGAADDASRCAPPST